MDSMHWHDEVAKLIKAIEPHIIASVLQIQKQLRHSGRELNNQFKQEFFGCINDGMNKVIDRLQSQSLNASFGKDAQGEEVNSKQFGSENSTNESVEMPELVTNVVKLEMNESELDCVNSYTRDRLVSIDSPSDIGIDRAPSERDTNKILSKMPHPTEDQEEKCSKDINPQIDESTIKIESQQMSSIGKPAKSSNLSLVNHLPPIKPPSMDTTKEEQCISKRLEDYRLETNSMASSNDVSPISLTDIVVPTQMPDLLMNLNTPTMSRDDDSTLKRKRLNEICDETVAKKYKEDVNNGRSFAVHEMVYGCVHCVETVELKVSIEEVYHHWLSKHSSEFKPFQYQIVAKMRCFSCDFAGSYKDLVKHHQEQHLSESFAVLNVNDNSACGICALSKLQKSELIDHFNKEHESMLQRDVTNPILLNDETLMKLLTKNVNRNQCGNCDRVFATQPELEFHHTIEHADVEISIRASDQNPEPYLICDYCQTKIIDRDKYLNHIEEHSYVFKCSKCNFQTDKMMELVGHEKKQHRSNSLNFHCLQFCELLKKHFATTKVIFNNGLVLFNHQLANTKFGNGQILFDLFIEELIEIIRQNYKMEHETNDETDAINQNDESESITKVPMMSRPPISARVMKMKELRAQNRLINNLCIYGVPYFKNENKNAIFLLMCSMLQANVSQRDIAKITRAPGRNALLIVELTTFEVKERILQCAYMKPLWSSDLIDLPAKIPRTRVFINIHTTKFYGRMAKIARNAMKCNKLHIFWITKYGFLVKRTKNTRDKIILSPDELIDYINQRQKSTINREKQFYQSIEWVPKSNGN